MKTKYTKTFILILLFIGCGSVYADRHQIFTKKNEAAVVQFVDELDYDFEQEVSQLGKKHNEFFFVAI